MGEDVREVRDIEREFVMLLGYFVHKYCDNLAELDHQGFINFMDKNPQLERRDDVERQSSFYRVTFSEPIIH